MAEPRSALAGRLPWSAPGEAVVLAESAPLVQIDLRLATPADAVGGVRLPLAANRVAVTRLVRSLWLGPDEWLVTAPAEAGWLTTALARALAATHASVVDVSSSRAVIELSGRRARDLLETGCGLDLHPRAFGPGQCAQTLLARLPVILDPLDATPRYRLFVPASAARWLCDWLIDAAADLAEPG